MVGALLGGWLSDKIGPFRVQFLSLTLGGLLFLLLADVTAFTPLAAGIFALSVTVECLRPANAASVALYARPENVTRSFSLNRMAVNLGFSIGPALGGVLASFSYKLLFVADGLTCIAAAGFFYFYFRGKGKKAAVATATDRPTKPERSPYGDIQFLAFILFTTGYAVVFFQLFTTLPLYYREAYQLPELQIGLLLGFNGLLVFLFEMIVVHKIGKPAAYWPLVVAGTLLCGASFALLNLFTGIFVLLAAVVLLTFSEIFAMPFMVTYTVNRAGEKNRGAYIGLYTLAYSAAFILAPYLGTRTIEAYGYPALWWAAALTCLLIAAGFAAAMREKPVPKRVKKEV